MVYTKEDFNIKKLGCFYDKEKTVFRVFAPESESVFLVIGNNKYAMHKNGYIFEIGLKGDLELIKYHYENNDGVTYRDPFAYFSDIQDSYVLDTDKFEKKVFVPNRLKDIIVYETSVRDFSSDKSVEFTNPKKFLGLIEEGKKINDYSVGLDYLKGLGVTHLQLMPTFEFDKDKNEYNWGYNPLCFNYLEKDYVVDEGNPYAYINEFRNVVNKIHEAGLRVVLDVVLNHVYKAERYDLNKMLKGHAFRYKEDGSLAQGTFCGNEINSEDVFVRAYLVEMMSRCLSLYDIDGLRLDLMGILDIETVNEISKLNIYKEEFIVYGEGWNMGDVLPEDRRATSMNADKMRHVGFFNDFFRDNIIKYVCGDIEIKEDIKKCLDGNNINLRYGQSVNYVECHDNMTFYDRILKAFPEESDIDKKNRCKLALSLCILARGIPFIHSGQEFLRTKNMQDNSYNAGDEINKLDWNRRCEFDDVIKYTKELIEFRRAYDDFNRSDVSIWFEDYYECLIYHLGDYMIVINPIEYEHTFADSKMYNVLFDSNGKTCYTSDVIKIPAHSLVILRKSYII